MNENLINKALASMCENPFWKEYYETAPTCFCKRYIKLKFYYSDCLVDVSDYEEYKKECLLLESKFVKEDWSHLYKYCGNNPRKVYYRNKMNECD